jgi:hypothetical protein
MKATVPQDQQPTPLWQEVDLAFGPLSDAVDAASNVLKDFGEAAEDPAPQAAITGPKLREIRKEVYDRVLALCGHKTQTPTDPPPKQPDNVSQIDYALCDLGTVCDAVSDVVDAHVHEGVAMNVALDALGTQLRRTWRETYDKVLELAKEGGDDA